MNDGVKIIIERIGTNPEEFEGIGRWYSIIESYKDHLPKEDSEALNEALAKLAGEKFTARVLKELMGADDEDPLGKPAMSGMHGGGATQGQYLSQLTQSQQVQQTQLRLAQLALQAQQASHLRQPSGLTLSVSTTSVESKPWWKRLFK